MSRTPRKLYAELASLLTAVKNCQDSGNDTWESAHTRSIEKLCELLPSGSGVDSGTKFDMDDSTPERLVFSFSYHHMDENGFYDGWTDHQAIVTPSLAFGFNLRITGRDRNQIKDYLHELFAHVLDCLVWQTPDAQWHNSIYEKLPAAEAEPAAE